MKRLQISLFIVLCIICLLSKELIQAETMAMFSVTVPLELPIIVDKEGEVITFNEIKIINNGNRPIEVKNLNVETFNGWGIGEVADYRKDKVGKKEFTLELNGDRVDSEGRTELTKEKWKEQNERGYISIDYEAEVSVQKENIYNEKVAEVVFTIGWLEEGVTITPPKYFKVEGGIIAGFSEEYLALGLETQTDIVIPSYKDGFVITEIGKEAFKDTELTSVVFQEGIEVIGEGAFDKSKYLKRIEIPKSIAFIGENAFKDCKKDAVIIFKGRTNMDAMQLGKHWSGNAQIIFEP